MRFIFKHPQFIIILTPPEGLILGAFLEISKIIPHFTPLGLTPRFLILLFVVLKKAADWLPFLFYNHRLF